MSPISRSAHAKVNVFLRVLGRRDDGFHDIETLIFPLSMHDRVTVDRADGMSLEVVGTGANGVPSGEQNLALRAARALAAEAGGDLAAHITIEKAIPVAAGLGGGSADAAATLLALDELWSTALAPRDLARVGLAVGSDVPALLAGEPVFVRGRGEDVEPVIVPASTWVMRTFDFGVSASDAYAWWDERPSTGPDPGAVIAAAETANDELLGSALFNDLQAPVSARHPEVGETVDALVEAGAFGAVMSGSGPTVAALCSFATADTVAAAVPGALVVNAPRSPARIDADPSGVV